MWDGNSCNQHVEFGKILFFYTEAPSGSEKEKKMAKEKDKQVGFFSYSFRWDGEGGMSHEIL